MHARTSRSFHHATYGHFANMRGEPGITNMLAAAIVDCLDWKTKPRRKDLLKSYNCESRVRAADDLLFVQPYKPWLFRQGQLAGPTLLMVSWRGKVAEEDGLACRLHGHRDG